MCTVFVLCDTNEVVAKLTHLCSFFNNLNAINFLFILIIWELMSQVHFEA